MKRILIPAYPLKNFEMQRHYQDDVQLILKNESKFNGVYSRNNLPEIKNAVNVYEYAKIGTHWILIFIENDLARYFVSFRVEHIP